MLREPGAGKSQLAPARVFLCPVSAKLTARAVFSHVRKITQRGIKQIVPDLREACCPRHSELMREFFSARDYIARAENTLTIRSCGSGLHH